MKEEALMKVGARRSLKEAGDGVSRRGKRSNMGNHWGGLTNRNDMALSSKAFDATSPCQP